MRCLRAWLWRVKRSVLILSARAKNAVVRRPWVYDCPHVSGNVIGGGTIREIFTGRIVYAHSDRFPTCLDCGCPFGKDGKPMPKLAGGSNVRIWTPDGGEVIG